MKFRGRVLCLGECLKLTIPRKQLKKVDWETGSELLITIRGATFVRPLGSAKKKLITIPKPVAEALGLKGREVVEVSIWRRW
jgi:bifunctional DNA-binding transcriptional regulator/antitoxin component of YhaV-PrlF toxin-antitoxin module